MSLERIAARMKRAYLPSLFLLTDDARPGDISTAMARLPRGAAVIFRHYGVADREMEARRLRSLAKHLGLVFLVAGDPRLAARVHADGFHAPEKLAALIGVARRLLPRGLMTMAAHGEQSLIRARRLKADMALLSPVFATRSHPGATPLGVLRFTGLATSSAVPVVALGGIDARHARRLGAAPIAGLAAIGALMDRTPLSEA